MWSQEQKKPSHWKQSCRSGLFRGKACLTTAGKHSLRPLKFYTVPTSSHDNNSNHLHTHTHIHTCTDTHTCVHTHTHAHPPEEFIPAQRSTQVISMVLKMSLLLLSNSPMASYSSEPLPEYLQDSGKCSMSSQLLIQCFPTCLGFFSSCNYYGLFLS